MASPSAFNAPQAHKQAALGQSYSATKAHAPATLLLDCIGSTAQHWKGGGSKARIKYKAGGTQQGWEWVWEWERGRWVGR